MSSKLKKLFVIDTIEKEKRQPIEWQDVFSNHVYEFSIAIIIKGHKIDRLKLRIYYLTG